MADDSTSHLYRLFADLLGYPTPALAGQAQEAAAGAGVAQATALLHGFYSFVEQASPARLEELYTGTFDLQAVCYPYVGYHLFGDSYKRGMFMAQLNAGYLERGFSAGKELPDHVAVILRFLASVHADPPLHAHPRQGTREGTEASVPEASVPEAERSGAERSGATAQEDGFSQALLHEGLIPALDTMVKALGDQSDNPYAGVIRALLLVLSHQTSDVLPMHRVVGKRQESD
jgi:nitrate reductase molybdenum cofactor assembly chaperone